MAEIATMPMPLSTTWAVLATVGATVTFDDEALVVSADVPGHRWARAICVLDGGRVNEASFWLARAAREFGGVAHPAIGLPARPDRETWRRQPCPPSAGIAVEWWPQHWVALEATTVTPPDALADEYQVVEVCTAEQWEQLADLPSPGGEDYRRSWTALKRRRQEAGRAMFFVGVRDGQVVASGGIVLCDLPGRRVARFEDVRTLPGHRRRGLASHLVAAAHRWAADRGATSSVLVADAEGEAVDLYHRLGYRHGGDAWMVLPRRAR